MADFVQHHPAIRRPDESAHLGLDCRRDICALCSEPIDCRTESYSVDPPYVWRSGIEVFDAAVVAKCGHRFHVRYMHRWLTEGDADNKWNQMSTLAQTTTPLLVYTIDLHDRLILHRGWPTGLDDVKEDFHRRFPHDTQKDDSYWDANTCWCKKNSDSSNPCQAINHLFKDARERTTQAMIDYLVQERGVRMIKREDTYICPECII
ncbi:hypothetical protein T492DRAFT_873966 [Pavlovales sp. CCMP2436]|nr:hypothetical protein T492DRAFT_873966 [Pavlovales sp. CCMP2436]